MGSFSEIGFKVYPKPLEDGADDVRFLCRESHREFACPIRVEQRAVVAVVIYTIEGQTAASL